MSAGVESGLLRVLTVEIVGKDVLREARKGARGEISREGHVNRGWLAVSVLVTRGVVAAVRYSYFARNRSIPWGDESEV